jgi:hypothetical protein
MLALITVGCSGDILQRGDVDAGRDAGADTGDRERDADAMAPT